MLDYKKMLQFVDEIDTTDRNTIEFTLKVKVDSTDFVSNEVLSCRLARRVSGWCVRAELWINDRLYHSDTRYDAGGCEELIDLHEALMTLESKRNDAQRNEYFSYINEVHNMMEANA